MMKIRADRVVRLFGRFQPRKKKCDFRRDQGRNSECGASCLNLAHMASSRCRFVLLGLNFSVTVGAICSTDRHFTDLHPGYRIWKKLLLLELNRGAFPSRLLLWCLWRCNYPSFELLVLFLPLSRPARAGIGTEREMKIKI
jgi:hypothetical protein